MVTTLAARTIRGLYRDGSDPLLLLSFVYVLMFLLQNAAEATILQRNSMSWTLWVMLYVAVRQATMAAPSRRRRTAPRALSRPRVASTDDRPHRRLPVA
jgi:hypothetical protein